MSRIGNKPISLPAGVTVDLTKTGATVKGPKGLVLTPIHPSMQVENEAGVLKVSRPTNSKLHRSLHGLTRSLLAGAVVGVTEAYRRVLEIVGVGYQGKIEGTALVLQVGFCQPVRIEIPPGLDVNMPTNQQIVVLGCEKALVGQFAANVRKARPPEPYNGKGIRYQGERVVRKAGKSFVSGDK